MADNEQPKEEPTQEKIRPGILGGPKPPGSGRAKGTPNKRNVLALESIRASTAAEMSQNATEENSGAAVTFNPDDITGIRILYLYANRAHGVLGLTDKDITPEMQLDAAAKLSNFELPKKRAIEVTGIEITEGKAYAIGTGPTPPQGETEEDFASRVELETLKAEAEAKKAHLAKLEREREEAKNDA